MRVVCSVEGDFILYYLAGMELVALLNVSIVDSGWFDVCIIDAIILLGLRVKRSYFSVGEVLYGSFFL